MTNLFQPGDTVALRSGGYAMTVTAVKAEVEALAAAAGVLNPSVVQCGWLDDRGCLHQTMFSPASLTRVKRWVIERDGGSKLAVWVFADTGLPIADHVAMKA
jgi:uncharacterized protein YodC (DUF2158 family)